MKPDTLQVEQVSQLFYSILFYSIILRAVKWSTQVTLFICLINLLLVVFVNSSEPRMGPILTALIMFGFLGGDPCLCERV